MNPLENIILEVFGQRKLWANDQRELRRQQEMMFESSINI